MEVVFIDFQLCFIYIRIDDNILRLRLVDFLSDVCYSEITKSLGNGIYSVRVNQGWVYLKTGYMLNIVSWDTRYAGKYVGYSAKYKNWFFTPDMLESHLFPSVNDVPDSIKSSKYTFNAVFRVYKITKSEAKQLCS